MHMRAIPLTAPRATSAGKMACFVKTLTLEAVKDIEIGNPFLRMKLFSFTGVESKPLTLDDVPQSFRPYPGCIFVSTIQLS